MNLERIDFNGGLIEKQTMTELIELNELTKPKGLVLSKPEMIEILETRSKALKNNGRIEFGGGLVKMIAMEFMDSPYITQDNYAETINELMEIFYYYKNESFDAIGDADLVKLMGRYFDGVCQGSLDLLAGRELDRFAEKIRKGIDPECDDEDEEEELY